MCNTYSLAIAYCKIIGKKSFNFVSVQVASAVICRLLLRCAVARPPLKSIATQQSLQSEYRQFLQDKSIVVSRRSEVSSQASLENTRLVKLLK